MLSQSVGQKARLLLPDGLTWLNLILTVSAALSIVRCNWGASTALFFLGALCDLGDGYFARKFGSDCPRGAALDSWCDRYADFFPLAALAIHFGADPLQQLIVLAAILGTFMVSYVSAQVREFGAPLGVGHFRRPTRVMLLGSGLFLQAVLGGKSGTEWPLITAVAILALATHFFSILRFRNLREKLGGPSCNSTFT